MPILFLLGVGLIFFGASKAMNTIGDSTLPDVAPENQGGNYKKDFDSSFVRAKNKYGVPFALLKAHAIMESSLNPKAYRDESGGRGDRKGWASRGLMQLLMIPGKNRWAKYGLTDAQIGDGSILFDPDTNAELAAGLIRDNLKACGGNLRDAINMYNSGKKESEFKAPYDYVNKVLGYYKTLIKKEVIG